MCVSRVCAFPRHGTHPSSTAIFNHHGTIFHYRPAGVAVVRYKMTHLETREQIRYYLLFGTRLCFVFVIFLLLFIL